ncbi:RNA N6-adenosine-methyltransferase mettl16-like [Paramacrobiotus metropolitanus]|uniref:RNA N6-adenosine-methyltransferase mettl16-like n=1 Tax=Paramacrobiotus metropolitanus TaxID=2943436 RepID=UPI00244581BB|nr:RNA N6-adenosine-methyltransferase mettl16-like [Paramacrobiotus metropolitanus]
MSLNRFMHPRNIYKSPPDFRKLSATNPDLAEYMSIDAERNTVSYNFDNPAALRALTCALLRQDFGLSVDLPLNHLIPTVPNRLNYVLWVEDLLESQGLTTGEVWGLDVGAGASCIYPLLGARKNGWHFVATESNDEAYQFAKNNVERNGLTEKILVTKGDEQSPLMSAVESSGRHFTFCMSNPPFFESQSERTEKASYKPPKLSANPVAESDAVAEGGEVAFVGKMIEESLLLENKIKIYTSMLGKKSSLTPLKTLLHSKHLAFTTTEFCQGRTMRWGLAWSTSLNLDDHPLPHPLKTLKKPVSYPIDFGAQSETSRMSICLRVMDLLQSELQMYVVAEGAGKWRVAATEMTWRSQRRKRREKERMEVDGEESVPENGKPVAAGGYVLQFFLLVRADAFRYGVELEWVDGEKREYLHEVVVFLKNRLAEVIAK